jgi:GntR family transcriptional regulator / MocR family aminotransferase
VIIHGAAEGISMLASVLGGRIAVEALGHQDQREMLRANGSIPVPTTVDSHGIDVSELATAGCQAVMVTAAHQFPLGVALHPARRHALLAWAREHDGLIIEDDYDAEHRYDRPALRAMQAMEPARVAYMGSVSKTLAPGLRLGWLVLPPAVRAKLVRRKELTDLGCGVLPQATFARLLRSGGYDRHLRRTRSMYRARRDALLTALASCLPEWRPVGVAAGLHVVVRLPEGTDDTLVSRQLAERGVNASALSTYAAEYSPYPGLVLGYAALSPDRLRAAVAEIAATQQR